MEEKLNPNTLRNEFEKYSFDIKLDILKNLSQISYRLGDFKRLEKYLKKILEIYVEEQNPDIAGILGSLATAYQDLGNFEDALPLQKRALAIAEE